MYILDLYPLEQFINVTRFDYTDIEGAVRKYNELESKSVWLDVSLVDGEQIENNVVLGSP